MTTMIIAHPDMPLHEVSTAAVTRVLEAHDVEPEFVTGPTEALAAMMLRGEIDLFISAWLPDQDSALLSSVMMPLGNLFKPAFGVFVPETLSGVTTMTDLAASDVSRDILAPESLLPALRQAIAAYGLTEAGFTIESRPDEEAFEAMRQSVEQGEPVLLPLMNPNFLIHRLALRALDDPRGGFGAAQDARMLLRAELRGELDSDMLDELDELTLGNKVVSALDEALRHGGMTADDAAEAWQRGRLLPR